MRPPVAGIPEEQQMNQVTRGGGEEGAGQLVATSPSYRRDSLILGPAARGTRSTQLHMFTSIINFIFYISIMIFKSHLQNTPPHLILQRVTLIYHILVIASSCSNSVVETEPRGSIHSFLGWSRTVGLPSDVYNLRLL